MATVFVPSEVGSDRTFSMGLSRRAAHWVSMIAERVALWNAVEPRIDLWASVGALALAGVATVAVFAVGSF